MKFIKAIAAFIIYFFLFLIIIAIIIPESILKSPAGSVIFFLLLLALSIYIAIKAYKLNTLSLLKIFNLKKENTQTKIKNEIDFLKKLSENNSSSYSSTSYKSKNSKPIKSTKSEKNADIEIVYEKENGEISQRKIKVDKVDDRYLYGFCFLRNDNRTFRLDRIKKLTNLKTSETLTDNDEIIDYLQWMHGNEKLINQTNNTKNYIDEGYFYGKVNSEIIADVNKDFHIIYKNNYEFDAAVIRAGKSLYSDKSMLLIRNLDTDEFASLYVDKIIEMHDLLTGEVITNPQRFFEEIYEKEYQKYIEKEKKRQQKEEIENFIDEHLDLLKMLVYIAKCDGTINSKEKDIIIETLKKLFPDITEPNKIIDKISKNHIYFNSYNSFTRNAKQIIEKYPEIDFLEFTEKIVSTQKTVHSDEEKILNYLSKYYNRDYQLNYESTPKGQRTFDNEPCPHCNSTYTIKKGEREYKNYTAQRYECQNCGKIFSVKIEEKDNNE